MNTYYLNLAREINILKEDNNDKSFKKISDTGNKLLNSINNIDFSSDTVVEGIYYTLSSFLSISILVTNLPLIPKIISSATNKHLNTKVLPKYRHKLLNVYTNKLNQINDSIENFKLKIDDENKSEIENKIKQLSITRDQLKNNCDRLKLVD